LNDQHITGPRPNKKKKNKNRNKLCRKVSIKPFSLRCAAKNPEIREVDSIYPTEECVNLLFGTDSSDNQQLSATHTNLSQCSKDASQMFTGVKCRCSQAITAGCLPDVLTTGGGDPTNPSAFTDKSVCEKMCLIVKFP